MDDDLGFVSDVPPLWAAAKVVHRLAPGVVSIGDELHIDFDTYIRSLGGDPASERDQRTAMEAVLRLAEENGIPVEIVGE